MTMSLSRPLAFPLEMPDGFPALKGEPEFDPAKHLALETPREIISLADMGYAEEERAGCPTQLGITSTFRVLSDEGAACLLEVARGLEPYVSSNARISRNVRGGAYQSKFLRDLCLSPDVTEVISQLCDAPMLPHTIPHQLGHLNFNPLKVGENVDKWHTDTLRVDFVMFVTDPNSVEGGEFEYFNGTKHEMAALKAKGQAIPQDRIVAADLPGPGYAVLQQGNLVVHRAKGLRAPGERITMVNGYVAADTAFEDYCRFDQLRLVDPEHVAASEYSRHMTWMGREMLNAQLSKFQFSKDRGAMAQNMEDVALMLKNAADQLRADAPSEIEHFGDA